MRHFFLAATLGLLPLATNAQEFFVGPTVDELNDITMALDEAEFSKADYIEVLDSGCVILEHAVETDLVGNAVELRTETDRETIIAFARSEQFSEIEGAIFAVSGATPQTTGFLLNSIKESEGNVSFGYFESSQTLVDLKDLACDLRGFAVTEVDKSDEITLASLASDEEQSTARSLANGAMGVTAMFLDGLWMKGSAGIGAYIGGSASMGWGWNRVEQSFFDLFR
jgi:hypothetical protein